MFCWLRSQAPSQAAGWEGENFFKSNATLAAEEDGELIAPFFAVALLVVGPATSCYAITNRNSGHSHERTSIIIFRGSCGDKLDGSCRITEHCFCPTQDYGGELFGCDESSLFLRHSLKGFFIRISGSA